MSEGREPPPDDQFVDAEDKDELFTSTKETLHNEDLEKQKEEEGEQQDEDKTESHTPAGGHQTTKEEPLKKDSTQTADEEDDEDLFKDDDDDDDDALASELSDVNLASTPDEPEKKRKSPVDEKPPKAEVKKEQAGEDFFPTKEEENIFGVEEQEEQVHDLAISVSDPQKKGDGMNAFMSYKVTTKTTLPVFKRAELVVDRRFSDFLGLHEKLVAKHRHVGRIVPPAPEKSLVGMTRVKMSKTKEEAEQIDFIERRRAALERYLNRVGRHKVLLQDPDFRDFLEQDDLPQSTNTRALSGAGVLRLVKNVEGAISKMTMRMTEDDVWFEEKQLELESLDENLRKLHHAVEDLVGHRKELAGCTASFARSAATLGNTEEHTALSRALNQLSEAFERVEGLHQEVANSDFYNVSEVIGDYIRLIGEIKEVFQVRVKSWHNWQTAEQSLIKKQDLETKLKAQNRNDKLPNVQSEIHEMESRVKTCKEEFDDLSSTIKKEITKFEQNRVLDLKGIILTFLKVLMKGEEQNVKFWEAFLPEARAIA